MVPYLLAAKVSDRNVLKRHDSQNKCYIISNIYTIMRNTEKLRYLSCLLSEAQLEIKSTVLPRIEAHVLIGEFDDFPEKMAYGVYKHMCL